jgi:hypothetical protein
MKTHLTHRFSPIAHLELMEYASDHFCVSYLTMEGHDEENREMWYSNNSDDYTSFADAMRGFNLRRDSENPWMKGK